MELDRLKCLPEDITTLIIFRLLELNICSGYKINLLRICKLWQRILMSNLHLWHRLYTNLGWTLVYTRPEQGWKELGRRINLQIKDINPDQLVKLLVPSNLTEEVIFNPGEWNFRLKDDSTVFLTVYDISTYNKTLTKHNVNNTYGV